MATQKHHTCTVSYCYIPSQNDTILYYKERRDQIQQRELKCRKYKSFHSRYSGFAGKIVTSALLSQIDLSWVPGESPKRDSIVLVLLLQLLLLDSTEVRVTTLNSGGCSGRGLVWSYQLAVGCGVIL